MLTRLISGVGLVVLMAAVVVVAGPPPARAGGGPGSGSPFGSVVCGQSYSPSCAVSAGSPGSTGAAGKQLGGQGRATLTSGGSGPSGCSGTLNTQFGCIPAGCTITVQTLACPVGVARPPGGGGAPAPPPPAVLAQLAVRYLRLPDPVIRSSPATGALQLTELPTWLWMAPGIWVARSATATVPGESVTATATPVSAAWQMGDGHTLTCQGPGTPYTGGSNPASPSPTCGHTYTRSSAGQPRSAFRVTVTITWDISWPGGGAAGTLPPLFTVAAALFRVAESQAVNP
jgi:hypothetical protein